MGNVRLALLVMTDPPRQSVDARAICEQMTRDSASSPALVSPDFFKQCMIARGASPDTATSAEAKNDYLAAEVPWRAATNSRTGIEGSGR
jgi:hypothetical protein